MEQQWLLDVLLPKVLSSAYPPGSKLVSHEIGDRKGGNAGDGGFASNTYQVKITVMTGEKEESDYVIAKIFPQDPAMRAMHNSEIQFQNETLWYSEIVPAYEKLASQFHLDVTRLWPKFYAFLDSSLAAIVMQDLSKEGFKLALPPANLSWVHASLAMEKIAQFHALSYGLANHNQEKYKELIAKLKDCRFGPDIEVSHQADFFKGSAQRGLAPLRSRSDCADIVSALDKEFDDVIAMHRRLLTPRDASTDVLCHGDFLRNNVLYKHDAGENAVDARLIDFATVRLASPCSDLVLFVYLSVDPSVIKGDGLSKLLRVYYGSLTKALHEMGSVSDPWKGKFSDLEKEFAKCVPFAYSVCAFFLPLMMAPSDAFQMESMMEMTPEEQEQQTMNIGGPEATQRLMDIIIDFQTRGFHKLW